MAFSGKTDLDILIFDATFIEFNSIANLNGWIEMENPVAKFGTISYYFKVNDDTTTCHLNVYFKMITDDGWLKEYELLWRLSENL